MTFGLDAQFALENSQTGLQHPAEGCTADSAEEAVPELMASWAAFESESVLPVFAVTPAAFRPVEISDWHAPCSAEPELTHAGGMSCRRTRDDPDAADAMPATKAMAMRAIQKTDWRDAAIAGAGAMSV